MRRAVILGGSGAIGWATTRRLASSGWDVEVTGRDPAHVPPDLEPLGAHFTLSNRHEHADLRATLAGGADLVVDCACYTAAHATALLPYLVDVTSVVVISSKAVYVDAHGRHSNSDDPPAFDGPVTEDCPTLRPIDVDYNSRVGYGPNKVAAEETLLASSYPVTVLRPSKVHGARTRSPREWVFVSRALDARPVVLLARGGAGADHPSAALNIAALIEVVADNPGRRILNAADPDCPNGRSIAAVIATHLGHSRREVLLDDSAPEGLGSHPWDRVPPIVLDTAASREIGYVPVGDYATTVTDELDWLVATAGGGRDEREPSSWEPSATDLAESYAAEDAYLSAHEIDIRRA